MTRYLTINGREYGPLSPREEEILWAGEMSGLAKLRVEVEALPHDPRCHMTLTSADEYTMCSCWKRDVRRLIAGVLNDQG